MWSVFRFSFAYSATSMSDSLSGTKDCGGRANPTIAMSTILSTILSTINQMTGTARNLMTRPSHSRTRSIATTLSSASRKI